MKINGDAPIHSSFQDSGRVDASKRDALSGVAKPDASASKGVQGSGYIPSAATVSMSNSASSAAALSRSIEEQPSIRVDLVNELKAQIASGTYKPSPDMIASAMVKTAFEDRV